MTSRQKQGEDGIREEMSGKIFHLSEHGTLQRHETHIAEVLQQAAKLHRTKADEEELKALKQTFDTEGKVVIIIPRRASEKLGRQLAVKRDLKKHEKLSLMMNKNEMDQRYILMRMIRLINPFDRLIFCACLFSSASFIF